MLVLASSSPRRKDILEQIGATPDQIISPDIDESVIHYETPKQYVARIASAKATSVTYTLEGKGLVLGADSIVYVGGQIIQKPKDKEEIHQNLILYSGSKISVLTSITLVKFHDNLPEKIVNKTNISTLRCKRLAIDEIKRYIDSNQGGLSVAGGVSITGIGSSFFYDLKGSYSSVLGLTAHDTYTMLRGMGYKFS